MRRAFEYAFVVSGVTVEDARRTADGLERELERDVIRSGLGALVASACAPDSPAMVLLIIMFLQAIQAVEVSSALKVELVPFDALDAWTRYATE